MFCVIMHDHCYFVFNYLVFNYFSLYNKYYWYYQPELFCNKLKNIPPKGFFMVLCFSSSSENNEKEKMHSFEFCCSKFYLNRTQVLFQHISKSKGKFMVWYTNKQTNNRWKSHVMLGFFSDNRKYRALKIALSWP